MNEKLGAKLDWYGENVKKAINGTLEEKLDILGEALTNKIRTVLSQKGTGRIYKIGTKIHQASAPGRPPAIMYGDLHGSIGHDVEKKSLVTNLIVGSWSDHAIPMEFGTKNVAPRPWLGVTLRENQNFIEKFLQTGWF